MKTYLFAAISWIVPIVASFLFVDPDKQEYTINIVLFKALMFVVLALTTYLLYRRLKPTNFVTPTIFLLVNLILDVIVLISVLQLPFREWLLTTVPIYFIVFYGLYLYEK